MEDKEDKEKGRERERGGEGVQHITRPELKTWSVAFWSSWGWSCDRSEVQVALWVSWIWGEEGGFAKRGSRRTGGRQLREQRSEEGRKMEKMQIIKTERCSKTYNSHTGSVCHPRSQRPAPSRPRPRGSHSARPHETGLESQPPPQPEPEARERERTAHNRETIAELFLKATTNQHYSPTQQPMYASSTNQNPWSKPSAKPKTQHISMTHHSDILKFTHMHELESHSSLQNNNNNNNIFIVFILNLK